MANEQVHPQKAVAPPQPAEPATAEQGDKAAQSSEEPTGEPSAEELRLLADTMPGDGPGGD